MIIHQVNKFHCRRFHRRTIWNRGLIQGCSQLRCRSSRWHTYRYRVMGKDRLVHSGSRRQSKIWSSEDTSSSFSTWEIWLWLTSMDKCHRINTQMGFRDSRIYTDTRGRTLATAAFTNHTYQEALKARKILIWGATRIHTCGTHVRSIVSTGATKKSKVSKVNDPLIWDTTQFLIRHELTIISS